MSRTIYDIEEEKINFINDFLVDVCLTVYPEMTPEDLHEKEKLTAVMLEDGIYTYFLDRKTPLLCIDLNLLIDGV